MRRAIATLVATIAGLVILLSFKTATTKTGPSVAIAGPLPAESAAGSASASGPGSDPGSARAVPSNPQSSSHAAAPTATGAASRPTRTPTPSHKATGTKVVTGSRVPVGEGGRLFGVIQVKVTLTNGQITALTAVSYPRNDPRSSEISSYAIPTLHDEVLSAQGTQIDAVSGATYTSNAYAQSVQAALDSAKA